jgi:TonB-linked SusC/RagA family outer membrane protein
MVKFYCKGLSFILKCMRISFVIISIQICCTALLFGSNLNAQNISLDVKNVQVKQLLTKIEGQASVSFVYDNKVLIGLQPVTLKVDNEPLSDILNQLEKQMPLRFKRSGNLIGISRTEVKRLTKENSTEQSKTTFSLAIPITGKVLDENGQPLPGATVTVKGTSFSTTTNTDGVFSLSNVPANALLSITFVGYEIKEVSAENNLTVYLVKGNSKLDEVQIIAYGTTTKRLSTGNISSVKADVISRQPITNPLMALEGRVAGLQITQSSGVPGAAVAVQIRGRNSIAAVNNPLYVVDGVPFTSANVGIIPFPGMGSPMNSINPSDIESIDILKDADATAIYGSRAANGVILITTKKGVSGEAKLDVNLATGFGSLTRIAPVLNKEQYLQVRKDAFVNSSLTPTISNAPDLLGGWDQNQITDWQQWYLGNPAKTTDIEATFSGGNNQIHFLMSGNYHHESNVLPQPEGYNRGNVHLSVGYTSPNKKLQVDANVFYNGDNNVFHIFTTSDFETVAKTIPFYPVFDASGKYYWVGSITNYKSLSNAYNKWKTINLNSDFVIKYNISNELSFKTNIGYNNITQDQVSPTPSIAQNPSTSPLGRSVFGNQSVNTYLAEPQLNFRRQIGQGKIDLLAGSTIQQINTNGRRINVSNYSSDLLLENPGYGTATSSGSNVTYNYLSFFGRLTYNWRDKYLLNGSIRRDGSSRFGPGKQFGNFGSLGMGWIFSNENFIADNLKWLSFGKIRSSYGTTGNDGIGDYGYLSIYSNNATYGTTPAISPTQIANSNYQWEVNKKFEAAVEIGVLKDKLLFSVTWYKNMSGNQLVGYPLPSTTGFDSYQANLPALVQNTGWEIELNTLNVNHSNFKWKTSANLTIPKNKLVSFPGLASTSYANTLIIGQPLSVIQKYHFQGIDPQTGSAITQDVNKDGIYTATSSYNDQGGDYVIAGNTDPKWYGGISNTINLNNFQLDIFFQYTRQNGYNLYTSSSLFGRTYNAWNYFLNYWKQPGDITITPKPVAASDPTLTRFSQSDATVSDASFLRLKNISLSYNLPTQISQKLKIHNLQIYVQGQNLLTITKYLGYDPELATTSPSQVPPIKMLALGFKCSL